jgi:serine/threonine protein kinase
MAVRIESHAEPIPGYKLIERIGGGGFGEVWKCEAPGGLHKAIKFVFGDLSAAIGEDGDDGHRAKQELKALSRVKTVRHPYILSLERFDIIDGQLLIVMELAERTLWDRYKECRTQGLPGIPRDELLKYMEEAAEALDLMNNQYQLQHLDIKPQNLFVVYQHVKVADFGLVKDLEGMQASVTGGVTPVYAAPETFDGWVSRFSDQYSLAICYQELLTGQRPFAGTTVRQLILQHLQAVPDVAPLPPGDQAAIAKALAKNPDDRHATCQEMVQLLRNASVPGQASNGQLAPTVTPRSLAQPPEREEGARSTTTQSAATACIRRSPNESHSGPTDFLRSVDAAVLQAVTTSAPKAPAEITGDGSLFPSLIIGVGAVGMTVLQKLRENLCRRFGSIGQAPHLRLLLLDTDPDAVRAATAGRPGAALSGSEVLLAPLNRPSYYLRPRDGKPALESWLNPRMLYRIPRSQVTTGVRALGRLAFCDNYRTIVRRLQMELDACLDPAGLQTAARQSGLGLRTTRPRVYVVANIAGATGGGVFLDLAYTLRALLRQMGYAQPDVVGLLLLPPVDRCRTRVLPLGNACAALTELQHYSGPDSVFTARYHDREAPIHDSEPPFSRCFLLPLPDEADEAATRELVDLTGQHLYRDLCSPLGKAADLGRAELAAPRASRGLFYQTIGLYQLAWPRHALMRETGRRLCQRLLQRWMSKDSKPIREGVQVWIQEEWARLELGSEQMIGRLRDACQNRLRQAPEDAFLAAVQPLAERCAPPTPSGGKKTAPPTPELTPADAAAVLEKLEELIGKPGDDSAPDAVGALSQCLHEASEKLVSEWGQKLAEMAVHLIEEPQFRLAGAEEAIRQVVASIEQILQHHEPLARDLSSKASEAYVRLRMFLAPAKVPGRRPTLSNADVLELLRSYPKWRFQSLVLQTASAAFLSLRGHLSDEAREINFCRVRLTELQHLLETPTGAAESEPRAGRLLLPSGAKDLSEAADGLMERVGPEALLELDARMQDMIREQFTALVHICLAHSNLLKNVEVAMSRTADEFAGELLGETNAAELFLEQHPDEEDAQNEASNFFDEAEPELAPGKSSFKSQICVLAAPPGPAGERFRTLTHDALPEVEVLSATAEDDIVFYREISNLPLAELEQLGSVGQDAYRQMSAAEDFTPHTRIDVDFVAPSR